MKTLDDWIASLPDDEWNALCTTDAWVAGAQSMLDALIDKGFISQEYEADARAAVVAILRPWEYHPADNLEG
jgi:hypothetical protein